MSKTWLIRVWRVVGEVASTSAARTASRKLVAGEAQRDSRLWSVRRRLWVGDDGGDDDISSDTKRVVDWNTGVKEIKKSEKKRRVFEMGEEKMNE